MIDILLDAIIDALKLIPFLFLSFMIMELIEHKLNNQKKLVETKKYGPLIGSSLGVIPQCGFSALASNLYSARVITLGTLVAVYLSTSDEMLPIMLSHKTDIIIILKILLIKFLLGLLFGFLIDFIYHKKHSTDIKHICEEDHCHCEDGIIKSSLIHTLKITLFILIINIALNSIIDENTIFHFATSNKILAPIITSFIGLIPNCASSVIITELYLDKIITLGSALAGLLSGSGVGILVLFKQNKNLKENLLILLILVFIASVSGIIFNYI